MCAAPIHNPVRAASEKIGSRVASACFGSVSYSTVTARSGNWMAATWTTSLQITSFHDVERVPGSVSRRRYRADAGYKFLATVEWAKLPRRYVRLQ